MKKLIQKILIFLNILVALTLLFSYLSVHISPGLFWPPAFFGLAYPFLLGLNIIFLLFWTFKRKKYLLISFLCIAIGYNHILNTVPLPFKKKNAPEAHSGKTLKVLSYNVRAFNIYDWLNDPNTDRGIFNFIRSEHPDVICLQEFFSQTKTGLSAKRLRTLFGETPYSHIEYSGKDGKNSGFGIATFSRYPIIKRGLIRFEHSANLSIFTDIVVGFDTLRIINNHLQSVRLKPHNYAFLDSLKVKYDEKQMKELHDVSNKLKQAYVMRAGQSDEVFRVIKKSPYKNIVCGDFNDTPVSYSYHKIRGNMKDAWVESGKGWGNTYLGNPSFRIDYIFYDRRFSSKDFERVKTRLSDHYPILTVLDLQ